MTSQDAADGAVVPYDPSVFEGYKGPPLPPDEDERCRTLETLDVQPEVDDPVLSSLCKLLCSLLKVPAAAVSIVERERQVLKSTAGNITRCVVPRSASFCQHTFVHKLPVVMVVEDTLKDVRFADNPLVAKGVHPIRFYAGAPLIASNGHRIGAMCLIDQKPRTLSVEDYRVLCTCAEMVVRRLEKQQFELLEASAADKMLRTLDTLRRPLLLADMSLRGWPVLHANEAWLKRMALPKGTEIRSLPFWDYYEATQDSQEAVVEGFNEQISQQKPFFVSLQLKDGCNKGWPLQMHFKPATQGSLDPFTPEIAIPEDAPFHDNPADDLPYYIVTILDDGESSPAQPPQAKAAVPQKGMPPAFSTDSAIGTDATKKVQVQPETPAADPVAAEPAPTAVKPAAEAKGTEKKLGCFGKDSDSQRACVIS
ncbi:hypothetical protein COCSUDRAFT_45719 [Coccomyxa subellipsoidea C-169]|uniref:GAF domain-containing protein n=1 Tax=Coccomyxa subellipsoidea (strain C-169) TaxID=574566 RepID=I0Z8T9_COCSC|nr:hypothetical protein COCSUDRAFT_45719 [Coccomyxa subellipsoidea C-169]EIE27058.1 hypothetical protein COCSUDRAFT_45719 [Coccomyxa subellipsoidea C-169]|eukprot:XP_005651602.1 hypothetical protein COCSUDRAFT_45719 [Coccomyxa subellipsoidea C-169]